MSGHAPPPRRRFVRAAWLLIALQLVAAAGAAGLAVWAATEVQRVIDQRDALALRMREMEARRPPPLRAREPEPRPEPVVEDDPRPSSSRPEPAPPPPPPPPVVARVPAPRRRS